MTKLLGDIERAAHEAARNTDRRADMAVFQSKMAAALRKRELSFQRQVWIPEHWAGMELNCGDLFDFEVEGKVAVVLASSARELLEREKRLGEALCRTGLAAGIVVWLDTNRKEDRCRRVVPAGCGAGA